MAEVRALLKAKNKEREKRIVHPYANYTSGGQLRCNACGTVVKHASAWDGHLGSKAHRNNVLRLREIEKLQEEKRLGKRKADDDTQLLQEAENRKKQRTAEPEGLVPPNFFPDPTHVFTPLGDQDSNSQEVEIDPELAAFEAAVLGSLDTTSATNQEVYNRATVFAEPELADTLPAGFPASAGEGHVPNEELAETSKESEEDIRKRKVAEEKELIMDRLLDEERAQEEADAKVTSLKARLEYLRKIREAARAKKMQT